MMRHSFVFFFSIILVIHLALMISRIKEFSESEVKQDKTRPLKVTLLLDHLKKKQIVQSEDTDNKQQSPDAYLSDKTRSFERQTKARKVETFARAAKGSSQKSAPRKKDISLSDLNANQGQADPWQKAAQEYAAAKKGLKNGDPRSRGISSTNDYVEEVPLGDFTHLNTVEYKYYGFYHRIRQKLEQFWGRSIQEKAESLMSQGRRIPASEEHITALRITMNQNGQIVDIEILGSSGVKELDDAAIESFNEAGPFPNPPKDLVVNGRVTIEWGFVVSS